MIIGIIVGAVLIIAGLILFVTKGMELSFAPIAVLIVGFLVFGVSSSAGLAFYNQRTLECTITDKDRGYNRDGGSEYRVYTEQCGTFLNQDSLFRGKFNSGDIQGQLKVGETYELEVAGPRVPFLSMFPNIFSVEPIDAN